MPVDTVHAEYAVSSSKWLRMRDVLAGEDTVKAAGERYIPKLEGQTEADYEAYVGRGFFYNAAARTLSGYEGMIFRQEPVLSHNGKGNALGKVFDTLVPDVDLLGTTLSSYARKIVDETLAIGRSGTLIDWQDKPEDRAYLSFYAAENILNWRVTRIGGKMLLTMVVLKEQAVRPAEDDPFVEEVIEQCRVLRLVSLGPDMWEYRVEVWQLLSKDKEKSKEKEWQHISSAVPKRRGQSLPQIPFIFHGPNHSLPAVERSPMEDIATANAHHFKINVDYNHGMHFTALPTAWVSGFPANTELKVGSRAAWVTENLGATAGYLEFKGDGLQTLERAQDRVERLLTVLGSRLLESQKRVSESAEALSIRQSGESSILANLSRAVSSSLTDALRWVYWWHSTEADPTDISEAQVLFKLNTDFEATRLNGKEIEALVASWLNRGISHDTLLFNFKQSDMLPPGRTVADELKLIAETPPPAPVVPIPAAGVPVAA